MNFVTKEPINKGWSSDKKYCVTDENGTRYLLRVSDIAQHDTKQSEFNMMKQVASFGVPMCQPIEFGTCEDGVYSIQSWIDGEDAEQVMSGYSDTEQYVYGLEAGRILRKIHSIPAPATQEDWEIRFNRKMDYKIKKYAECPIKYENGQAFIDYINENRHLLKNRPQVYQHGDYHIGNMMIGRDGKLYIIDFLFLLANALTLSLKSCVLILTEMTLEIRGKNLTALFGALRKLLSLLPVW